MQKKLPFLNRYALLIECAVLFICACNVHNNIPFPADETEFPQPVAKPLTFEKPQKYTWVIPNPDSVKPVTVTKVDFDKLPTTPFDISEFRPLTKPMTETKIDWDHLPDTTFSVKNLPTEKLKFRISILGRPTIVRTGIPHINEGAKTNLLAIDAFLPSLSVNSLIKDKEGDLWIGTAEGVCRFDGEYCSIYGHDQGLNAVNTTKLMEDADDKIWVGTQGGGVEVIDTKTSVIKQITPKEGLGETDIFGLLSDRQGNVWVGSWGGGVDIINEREGTLKHLKSRQGLSDNYVRSFLEESNGDIWVGTGSGADIIDSHTGKMKRLSRMIGLSENDIECLSESKPGEIWIGTRDQVNILYEKTGIIKHLSAAQGLRSDNMRSFFKDTYGRMWMSSFDGGVDIVDEGEQKIRHLGKKEGLSADDGWGFAEYGNDQIWIATSHGVNIFDKNGTIELLSAEKDFDAKFVADLLEDDRGKIWVGTDSGAYIIDRKLNTKKYLKIGQIVSRFLEDTHGKIWMATIKDGLYEYNPATGNMRHFGEAQGLSGNTIFSLTEDKQQRIWVGFNKGGINMIDETTETIKQLNTGQNFNPVLNVFQASNGKMWISAFGSLIDVMDENSGTFVQLDNGLGSETNTAFPIVEDSVPLIWAGTAGNGINIIDLKSSTITNFSQKEGLVNNSVIALKIKENKVFALTQKGLTVVTLPLINSSEGGSLQLQTYGQVRGIGGADENLTRSLLTRDGEFWWVTNGRITIMKAPRSDSLLPQTHITGIDIINLPNYFIDKNGYAAELSKTDTVWNDLKDTFYLKGHLPFGPGVTEKSTIQWDSVTGRYNMPLNLRLPYYENYLTFHFSGSASGNFDKTVYRYMLKGADTKWSDISESSVSENYNNLPTGEYTFEVCSRGFNGLWSKPAAIKFKIMPPWWKTWWAYFLYVMFFSLVVWGFSRYRSRNLQRQNKLLEEKVARRTKALNDSLEELKSTQTQLIQSEKMASLGELTAGIAHEIQNPLNFVNNFSEVNTELIDELASELKTGNTQEAISIANDIKENEQKINHHGKRADAIVKGMLQHARSSTGVKEPTDINALAGEYLRLAYHGLRAKDKNFNVTMKTDFGDNVGTIKIVPQDIGRALLNLYNNAFYAVNEKKKLNPDNFEPMVSVRTNRVSDKAEIRVKDNGTGVPQKVIEKIFQPFFTTKPAGVGTGLGLSLSYDIVRAHGGEIKLETVQGEGSEFIIQLPI